MLDNLTAPKKYPALPVLLIDDESFIIEVFNSELRIDGINHIINCSDSRNVLPLLAQTPIEIILLDLGMPFIHGEELIDTIISLYPDIPIIVITGHNDLETAVRCMKKGAFDFLGKPVEGSRLLMSVRHAIAFREKDREIHSLKTHIQNLISKRSPVFSSIVTNNQQMLSIFNYIESIAATLEPVLITGETGVGKGLIAQSIHDMSARKGEYVRINVSSLDDHLISDTLFGHTKGSFTGAEKIRSGIIEKANSGTLFLDEIGDLSQASQLKLLSLLQEKEFFPLGNDEPRFITARIIVATNKDIYALQHNGQFRKDLYYRLHTHHIHIPPLRERLDDIPLLVDYFAELAAHQLQLNKPSIRSEVIHLLRSYAFPGNIRELKAMIFDTMTRNQGTISHSSLKSYIQKQKKRENTIITSPNDAFSIHALFSSLKNLPTLKQSNDALIAEALKRSKDNCSIAAPILGITRQALSKRIQRNKSKFTSSHV